MRCTFNLSDDDVPFQPSGRALISTGEVDDHFLGSYAAIIEEIA
jgi:hypothetical protein